MAKELGVKSRQGRSHFHASSLPPALVQFIQHDTYSLLIKGHAGTGKTTLALTILRTLESRDSFFYISTRISPKQLFQYYPWLREFIEQPPRSLERKGMSSGQVIPPTFEDARLDEPESLFERITNQLMDTKSPVIIIDSWDAIASFMDKEARLNNERVLQTWRERADAKLIFISENPDDTTLDFLVDGIVELRQRHYENTRIREIALLKLRGVRIDRPSFVYTLENSMFRSFAPYKTINLHLSHKRSVKSGTNILTPELVRSGYSRLDSALGGGFPRKGLVLLELDSHVNTSVAMAFLGGLVSNFVSSGNPVLFQPFDWMDPPGVMRYLQKLIPSERKNLFKILWSKKVSGLADSLIVPSQKLAPATAAVEKMKKKYYGKVLLNIMGTDMLKRSNGSANLGGIPEELMSAARKGDLSIAVISRSQTEVLQYLSELSDVHLRILMINDTLFLQPIAPSSTLFALVLDGNHIELEPIV